MPKFTFPYGHANIEFSLSNSFEIQSILPFSIQPDHPEVEIVKQSLNNPLDHFEVQKLISKESSVVIVVNDKTRPVPNALLLSPLIDNLLHFGIQKKNIRFIIGMGTHIPMQTEEFIKVLPVEIVENYPITAHNCDDEANLVFKGFSSGGTPVFVNRVFDQADIRIVVGNIEPHHFAGFSGGVKSAAIGVCGRKTITVNHRLLLDKNAVVGNYETNPLRQDIEEIGRMIQITLALNVVLNSEKRILHCFWGKPDAVMHEGIQASRMVSMQKIPHRADLVVASAGGYPKDINLYQAQKAMTHASLILRPGGIILLAAACEEGIGSQGYEDFMKDVHSLNEINTKFEQQGFSVGPHKAIQIARIAKAHPIILVSRLPFSKVEQLLLTPAVSIDNGIEKALKINGSIHSVAILPFAVSTIPSIEETTSQ